MHKLSLLFGEDGKDNFIFTISDAFYLYANDKSIRTFVHQSMDPVYNPRMRATNGKRFRRLVTRAIVELGFDDKSLMSILLAKQSGSQPG